MKHTSSKAAPAALTIELQEHAHKKRHVIFHTRFKVILAVLLVLLAAAGVYACRAVSAPDGTGGQGADAAGSDTIQQQTDSSHNSAVSGDGSGSADSRTDRQKSDTRQAGGESYGYITLPSDWKDFKDTDAAAVSGTAIMQFTDASDSLIITLSYDAAPQADAQSAAEACWTQMEQEEASDIKGATVTLGGYEAYQVYGYYSADNTELVIWTFTDSAGMLHYISAEGPLDSIMEAVNIVNNTYKVKNS